MQITDIASVSVDWMEGYAHDPRLRFHLARGRSTSPSSCFRYKRYGPLFVALFEHEVRFVAHDPRSHDGFGGSRYDLIMDDSYVHGVDLGCSRCRYDPSCRVMTLYGPWSSSPSAVRSLAGLDCVDVGTYDCGHTCGTGFTAYTVDFVRDVLAKLLPSVELCPAMFGWTVKRVGSAPKNPVRSVRGFSSLMSSEQNSVIG